MSLSPNQLVATNATSTQVSCAIANTNGCNFSVASGGGTLNATMTQDLSSSGNPQFGNVTATGQVNASGTTDSTSTSTGALITAGGAGIAGNVYVGGQINSTNTTDSTSTTTGAIVTPGGVGVGGNIYTTGINFGGSTLSKYLSTTSWTPYLAIGGSTAGITYTGQGGSYSQIGSAVFCSFSINISSKGTNTGNLTITLPITSSNISQPTCNLGAWGLVGLNTGYIQANIAVNANSSYANINQSTGANNDYLNMTQANLTSTSGLWGSFWYFV
jgi:hypothetical protein